MRFFFPWKMAQDLRSGKVSDLEFFFYLLVFVLALVVYAASFFWEPLQFGLVYDPAWLEWANLALCAIATVGITLYAHNVNKAGDGLRFWFRYISISWPIGFMLGVVLTALFMMVLEPLGIVDTTVSSYVDLAISIIFYGLIAYLTGKYMRQIAGAR